MEQFLAKVREKARSDKKRIVFAESWEEKVLKASEILVKEGLVIPFLIGDRAEIEKKAAEFGVSTHGFEVRDPKHDANMDSYIKEYYDLRKSRGISMEFASQQMFKSHYFAAMMVHLGHVDGYVGGLNSEFKPFVPAFEIVGTKERFHKVSGMFLMVWDDRLLLFADSSTIIDPDAKDLAEIAIDTAESAKKFGITPKIAMLSFSTFGSARHPKVDKVAEATKLVKFKRPDLIVDGEMQIDAALVPEVAKKKCPASKIQGDANILVFPDLDSGNIAYKLVERLAKAKAIGPIEQGLKKPVNDLSRGCSTEDIVNVAAITAVEAMGDEHMPSFK